MKGLWLLAIVAFLGIDPRTVSRINSLKKQARKAYSAGDYTTASRLYRTLVDSLGVSEEEVKLNLAHALFAANDSSAADRYQPLTVSRNTLLRSIAQQQMGVLSSRSGNLEGALEWFKQALRANPANEDARYNYELVKKKLEEKKKQDQQKQDQKQDQQDKNDQNEDKKDQKDKNQQQKDQKEKQDKKEQQQQQDEQQKKDEEKKDQQKSEEEKESEKKEQQNPDFEKKLEEMKITPEKAKMILEAMKNQEKQYLQQNKRKATKPRNTNKPQY